MLQQLKIIYSKSIKLYRIFFVVNKLNKRHWFFICFSEKNLKKAFSFYKKKVEKINKENKQNK